MEQQVDEIVDIPAKRVRYFGGTGKMLLPCPATVAAVIEEVPDDRLITTDLLRHKLADQFEVEGVCPVTTQRSLQTVARDERRKVAYWRVINANGGLISRFPGGVEGQAAHLRRAGFTVEGRMPKVKDYREQLVRFG